MYGSTWWDSIPALGNIEEEQTTFYDLWGTHQGQVTGFVLSWTLYQYEFDIAILGIKLQ